jgi:hypothetical protein
MAILSNQDFIDSISGLETSNKNALKASLGTQLSGTTFYVDVKTGSSGNDGLSPQTAFDHLKTAYDACTSGAGDVIYLLSRGTTTAETTSYLTAALDWTKWGITVIGICAPTRFGQRARVSTAAVDLAYLIDVQGSNNAFYNISFYNGGTTGIGGVIVQGDRNYFENVHFVGGNGMTTPTVADFSLKLMGAQENTFVNCVIGTDTFDKGDIAGAQLLLDRDAAMGGCIRNRFVGCEFLAKTTAGTTCGLIKLNATGDSITRTMIFDDCSFHMYRDGAITAEVNVVIGTDPNNGFIIFKNCIAHGFEDWALSTTARVYVASGAVSAEGGGLTIVAD